MLSTRDLDSAVALKQLGFRADICDAGWTFWERRTLNIHRVVGYLRASRGYADPSELQQEIRATVGRHFRRSWWRGLAYGIVVDGVPLESLDGVLDIVDIRDNRKGTLQWVILTSPDCHAALAVHTWIEGYLSPVYRSVLEALEKQKVDVSSVTRPRDGLAGLVFDIADLSAAAVSFNARQHLFQAFKEPHR